MMEPLPNCFSIWARVSSRALALSSTRPCCRSLPCCLLLFPAVREMRGVRPDPSTRPEDSTTAGGHVARTFVIFSPTRSAPRTGTTRPPPPVAGAAGPKLAGHELRSGRPGTAPRSPDRGASQAARALSRRRPLDPRQGQVRAEVLAVLGPLRPGRVHGLAHAGRQFPQRVAPVQMQEQDPRAQEIGKGAEAAGSDGDRGEGSQRLPQPVRQGWHACGGPVAQEHEGQVPGLGPGPGQGEVGTDGVQPRGQVPPQVWRRVDGHEQPHPRTAQVSRSGSTTGAPTRSRRSMSRAEATARRRLRWRSPVKR